MANTQNNCSKVSVISATRNIADKVQSLIKSINDQDYHNFEHIVVDGASTDDTVHQIVMHSIRNPKLISEVDSGIADAWNKGISLATGDLFTFQGSGDHLSPNAIAEAVRLYESLAPFERDRTIIVGGCLRIDEQGQFLPVKHRRYSRLWRPISLRFWFPSCFIPRQMFENVGLFDVKLRIAIDTDWILRAIRAGSVFKYSSHLVQMESGGISDKYWLQGYREYLDSLKRHGMFKGYDKLVSNTYLLYRSVSGRSSY